MKKLFNKVMSAIVALLLTGSVPYLAVYAADTDAVQRVPYTVVRLNGIGNSVGRAELFYDGQFTHNSVGPFYYYNSKNVLTMDGYGGSAHFTADKDNGVVINLGSADTEFTNIILYGGTWGGTKQIADPETNLKIRYSSSTDRNALNKSTTDELLESVSWTELTSTDYTLTNITNGTRTIENSVTEPYLYNGKNTYTDADGAAEMTYSSAERTQQVLAVNLKTPVKAGSLYIEYDRTDRTQVMSLSEIEIYNNTGANVLFGNGISGVYPELKVRTTAYNNGYSAFGSVKDAKGPYIEDGGITLTDSKKSTGRTADRWYIGDTMAHGVPYVEYTLDGSTTIDQIDIYSGLLDEEGTYTDINGAETAYGAVDPQGVSLAYQVSGSAKWKTVKTLKGANLEDTASNGSKLTLEFGEITPSKIRLYAGIGTYKNADIPSAIVVKEIEAYNTADTDAAVDTVDILRADEGIAGNLDNRTSDTYIAKNSSTFNWNQETDITLSFSSPVEDGAEISISDNDDTKPDPTVGVTTLAADKCSAYTVVSGLQPNTTYSVSVTGASASYNFTTAGDYAINTFSLSDTATVAYDVTRIAADASDLMAIVGVYDGNMLISSSSELLAFTADRTNASGSLTATVPEGVSNPKVKVFLWDQKALKPIKYIRNNTYANQTLHIIGDSIYADYNVYTEYAPDYGIGQALSKILGGYGVKINNEAIPGCSTAEWGTNKSKILPDIKQGDYALISLCHNDQKKLTVEQYKANLVTIANDVKEQGGIPIFITAVPRYLWDSNGLKTTISVGDTTVDSMDYINAMLADGEENDIPVIDLNTHLRELYTATGTTSESYKHFYSTNTNENGEVYFDSTHLSETGATYCANWLIDRFEIMGLPFV